MLTNTFCCFKGLTVSAERRLWSSGCLEWNSLLVLDPPALSERKLAKVRAQILQAEFALEAGLPDWFLNRLKPPDTIRVLPHFKRSTGYLDIETTGLDRTDRLTTISLSIDGNRRCYVRGRNLNDFLCVIKRISLLVTYNGASFDLPWLRKEFGIDLPIPHIDLRFCLEALGYKGGLKRCEELLGVKRPVDEAKSGIDAIDLWERYEETNDDGLLLRLLKYNLRDVLSLEVLAIKVYNLVMSSFPQPLHLPYPELPDLDELDLHVVL